MHSNSSDEGIRSNDSGRLAGRGVLVDVLLLSRCDYMLHGDVIDCGAGSYFNPELQLVYASAIKAAKWQLR